MSSVNPYAPPKARVADDTTAADEVQPIHLWSARGRMGRVRYFAYPTIATLVFYLLMVVVVGIATAMGAIGFGIFLAAVAAIALSVLATFWGIQRCHDLDWSGWWVLLWFVPIANFIFWLLLLLFIPGTPGVNRYGAPPPPNKGALWLAVGAVGAIFVIGILAAIAISQYQDYVNRARAAQSR